MPAVVLERVDRRERAPESGRRSRGRCSSHLSSACRSSRVRRATRVCSGVPGAEDCWCYAASRSPRGRYRVAELAKRGRNAGSDATGTTRYALRQACTADACGRDLRHRGQRRVAAQDQAGRAVVLKPLCALLDVPEQLYGRLREWGAIARRQETGQPGQRPAGFQRSQQPVVGELPPQSETASA